MTGLPDRLMDQLHAEALAEHETRNKPYCTGDRCTECEPDEECCEASCGCCPRVTAQDWCWIGSENDDGSRYCSQHGERWLNDRTPEAELRYQILRANA